MEEVNKHSVLCDPAARDERISKVLITHSEIVETYQLVDFDLAFLDLRNCPLLLPKYSEPKQPIIEVDHSELRPILILLHLLDPNELFLVAPDLQLEDLLLCLDRVHIDVAFILIGLGDRDCPSRVIRHYHCLNRVHAHHTVLLYQVREGVAVLIQHLVGPNHLCVSLSISVSNSRGIDIFFFAIIIVPLLISAVKDFFAP